MKSWKTSVTGAITALMGFVAFSPVLFAKWPWVVEIAKYVMIGGFAVFGVAAKDADVSGGNRQQ